jgi:hypothetical protein
MIREQKKVLERMYRFEGNKEWQKDTSIVLWKGEKIKEVIPRMYDGTNFKIIKYTTKRITPTRTIVYQTLKQK